MQITNKAGVRGEFSVKVYDSGILIEEYTDNNLVVTTGKTNIAKLLGGDATGKKIEKIGVGTSSTVAEVGNTTLTDPFIKAITSVSYPENNSILFDFEITGEEANGKSIVEFGLFNTDNVMFARKVRPTAVAKTSSIRLVGTWKIFIS